MLKSGSSLWGRRNFDHFLAPVTLPAGCLWIIWIFWHKSDPLIFVSGWHTWWWSQCEFSLRVEAPDGLNTVTLYPGQMHRESTKKNDQTSLGTIRIYNTVPPFIKKLWNGAAIATRQPPQHPALGIQADHAGNVVVPRTKLHHLAGRLIPGIPASRHPPVTPAPRCGDTTWPRQTTRLHLCWPHPSRNWAYDENMMSTTLSALGNLSFGRWSRNLWYLWLSKWPGWSRPKPEIPCYFSIFMLQGQKCGYLMLFYIRYYIVLCMSYVYYMYLYITNSLCLYIDRDTCFMKYNVVECGIWYDWYNND